MILTRASVPASLTSVHLISTSTTTRVVVNVVKSQHVQVISTSMTHNVNASALMSRNATQENTMTMTRVSASVKIQQLALLPTIMTGIRVNVSVDLMIATLVSILTPRAVAASVQSIRPAQTISTSTKHLANVSAVMSRNAEMDNIMIMAHVNAYVEIHQLASIRINMIHTLASVSANLTSVHHTNTLTIRPVVAVVTTIQHALAISTSTTQNVNASAVTSRNVAQDNTMTTTAVIVNANILTISGIQNR